MATFWSPTGVAALYALTWVEAVHRGASLGVSPGATNWPPMLAEVPGTWPTRRELEMEVFSFIERFYNAD